VLLLWAFAACAASPEVDAAVQVFQSVAAHPTKLASFCRLNKLLELAGEGVDAATERQIQALVTQVGPDFERAWDLGANLGDHSPDAAVYDAAIEALASKCRY
jgi:hypothetical protein